MSISIKRQYHLRWLYQWRSTRWADLILCVCLRSQAYNGLLQSQVWINTKRPPVSTEPKIQSEAKGRSSLKSPGLFIQKPTIWAGRLRRLHFRKCSSTEAEPNFASFRFYHTHATALGWSRPQSGCIIPFQAVRYLHSELCWPAHGMFLFQLDTTGNNSKSSEYIGISFPVILLLQNTLSIHILLLQRR